MSSPLYYNQDSVTRFKKRKARFTFSEVHILLDEVRKHRHIVVGKFNRGVHTDTKKRTWAEITARVNEIGDCQREVIEIIKKWSDLKCDTKRKVAAMRAGVRTERLNSRVGRDLNPTEAIVHQILEMDSKRDSGDLSEYDPLKMLGDDEEGLEGEDDEDMIGNRSPDGDIDMSSMPPPPSHSLGMPMSSSVSGAMPLLPSPNYSGSSRESSQPSFEMQYEIPPLEDTSRGPYEDSDDDRSDDLLPSANQSSIMEDRHGNGGIPKPSTSSTQPSPSPSSSSVLPPPLPPPVSGQHRDAPSLRDQMLQSATLSVQEQHATNVMLETVSRSLELLSESVQQLAETQQEFVRDSLQLQRETVQVLREFTTGALSLLHDKINGRPAL